MISRTARVLSWSAMRKASLERVSRQLDTLEQLAKQQESMHIANQIKRKRPKLWTE